MTDNQLNQSSPEAVMSEICPECGLDGYHMHGCGNLTSPLQEGKYRVICGELCRILPGVPPDFQETTYARKQGWICPICNQGVSPDVDVCPCQKQNDKNWAKFR